MSTKLPSCRILRLALREPEVQRYEPATLCARPRTIVVFGSNGVMAAVFEVALSPVEARAVELGRLTEDRVTALMILEMELASELFAADFVASRAKRLLVELSQFCIACL